eukprot:CAMPEP_0113934562 /NCGR_PEP_ID=MMETSP1339-20121228/1886_1 /TAXON_ID=94617 /ORGANISM="Fibrocapsa japonica" /LENGTH=313 /DNA_ID=CAMNT_0000936419 /DNA_START=193 /DNA_END=1134 /DNA_ORIENTATION=+ /assembly_acc=CAM_ASM_000762
MSEVFNIQVQVEPAASTATSVTTTATNPLTGKVVEVKQIREHPQFPGKFVVEALCDGFQFTHPLPTIEELTKVYAEDYNDQYGRDPSKVPEFVKRRAVAQMAFMKEHIGEELWKGSIKTVGEAGAGWGELSRIVSEDLPKDSDKIITYELDHDSVKSMKEMELDARYGMMEVEESGTEGKYDLIMCSHATEHFREPRDVFAKLLPTLKKGGFLFLEIPLENPIPNWWGMDPEKPYWCGHLHFFGEGHLEKMLKSVDYEIVSSSCHDHPFAPGYVMPYNSELYDVDSVSVALDTEPSTSDHPKALRLLARKPQS